MTQDVCFTPLDTPTEKLLLDDYQQSKMAVFNS